MFDFYTNIVGNIRLRISSVQRYHGLIFLLILTDRDCLTKPDRVEEIQKDMFTILLHLFDQRKETTTRRKFCQIIDMFTKFRELTEGYMKCYQSLCNTTENIPEVLKFLFTGW